MSPSEFSRPNSDDELREDQGTVRDSESGENGGGDLESGKDQNDQELERVTIQDDQNDEFDDDFENELDDDEYYYDEDDYDDEEDDSESGPRKKKRRTHPMHCFNCNRQEAFFMAYRHNWIFSYFQGFSFGLVNLIGPFKCRCCGRKRFFCADFLHPKIWLGKKAPSRSRL